MSRALSPIDADRFMGMLEAVRRCGLPRVLVLSHEIGGGIERHLGELERGCGGRARFIYLRPAEGGLFSVALTREGGEGSLLLDPHRDQTLLLQFLRGCGVHRLHIHHLSGFGGWVLQLAVRLQVPLDLTLHDFFLIDGDPTLVDRNGRFRASPSEREELVPAWATVGWGVTRAVFRGQVAALLAAADRVFVPSEATREVFAGYYPNARFRVARHPDWEEDAPYPSPVSGQPRGAPLRIAVLGALGREKGADLLERVAIEAHRRQLPLEFHLVGTAYRQLDPAVTGHGAYREVDLPALLATIDPGLLWFPAQCAESYSYTLSHALRLGSPVLVPELGAFPERLMGRPLSWIVDPYLPVDGLMERLVAIRRQLEAAALAGDGEGWENQPLPRNSAFLYRTGYLEWWGGEPIATPAVPIPEGMARCFRLPDAGRTGLRVALLRWLLSMRGTAAGRWLQRRLPYPLQRGLKRALSRKPIAEIETKG